MKPKLVIFDWDGTLADTTEPIIRTFRQSFTDCGLPPPSSDRIRPLIGYSLPAIVRLLAPDADEHLQQTLIETYAAHYLNPNNQEMALFPDALTCLQTLKQQGCWLAVATGKGRSGLNRAIKETGTASFWDATACASEYPSKPAPDMVLALCDFLAVDPQDAWIVGDTTHDLNMAANAKAHAIGVTTGAHTAAQLASAPHDALIGNLQQLPDLLQQLTA